MKTKPQPNHIDGTDGGNDQLLGRYGEKDIIHGFAGQDVIYGYGGGDILYGDQGGDFIIAMMGDKVYADDLDQIVVIDELGYDRGLSIGNQLIVQGATELTKFNFENLGDHIPIHLGLGIYDYQHCLPREALTADKHGTVFVDFTRMDGSEVHDIIKGTPFTDAASLDRGVATGLIQLQGLHGHLDYI